MSKPFITRLVAGLTFAATLTSAHADESSQRCNALRAKDFIGEYLTATIREQARVDARATKVVVNTTNQQFEVNRLRIITDIHLKITHLFCG